MYLYTNTPCVNPQIPAGKGHNVPSAACDRLDFHHLPLLYRFTARYFSRDRLRLTANKGLSHSVQPALTITGLPFPGPVIDCSCLPLDTYASLPEGAAFDLSVRNEGAELRLESQGRQSDGQADAINRPAAQDEASSVSTAVSYFLLQNPP